MAGLELEWVSSFPVQQSFHETIVLPFFLMWLPLVEPFLPAKHPAEQWTFSVDLHNDLGRKMLWVPSFDTWCHGDGRV